MSDLFTTVPPFMCSTSICLLNVEGRKGKDMSKTMLS